MPYGLSTQKSYNTIAMNALSQVYIQLHYLTVDKLPYCSCQWLDSTASLQIKASQTFIIGHVYTEHYSVPNPRPENMPVDLKVTPCPLIQSYFLSLPANSKQNAIVLIKILMLEGCFQSYDSKQMVYSSTVV